MNFIEAKREFQIRYYLWAILEWEKEINESFPNLRSFKFGPIGDSYQFMHQLFKSEQLILAHSLLKRFHPDAVKILDEGFSKEEIHLLERYDEFCSGFYGVARRELGDGKNKYVSKNKLRKIMVAKFAKAYADRCVEIQTEKELEPWFKMKISGWIVTTRFEFGRRESLINYNQSIESETRIHHPENPMITGPAMTLGQLMSFASWLGICSQTRWEYLIEEDVDQACAAAVKFCGYFFEVVPKLLKDIEFEKITKE